MNNQINKPRPLIATIFAVLNIAYGILNIIIFIIFIAEVKALQIGYIFGLEFNILGLLLFPSGIGLLKNKKWGVLLSKIYAFIIPLPILTIAILIVLNFGISQLIKDASPGIVFLFIYSFSLIIFVNLKSVKNFYKRNGHGKIG